MGCPISTVTWLLSDIMRCRIKRDPTLHAAIRWELEVGIKFRVGIVGRGSRKDLP